MGSLSDRPHLKFGLWRGAKLGCLSLLDARNWRATTKPLYVQKPRQKPEAQTHCSACFQMARQKNWGFVGFFFLLLSLNIFPLNGSKKALPGLKHKPMADQSASGT